MADAEMYAGMNKSYHSLAIDRAIALSKMIRFITLALACDGYLNFMATSSATEWIDFPPGGQRLVLSYARVSGRWRKTAF
jgi:1,4-alpha-glucan branching enzyme